MCVAIPLGRRSEGPQGTRLGRFLRAQPWRYGAAVPVVLTPLLGALWALGALDPGAPLMLILVAQGLVAAPTFGLILTRLPAVTRTSPPGHLWFAASAALFLAGTAGAALGRIQGPGWVVPGLLTLAWAWWLAAAALRWHLGWSRVRLGVPTVLLPVAGYGGALSLGLAAVAAALDLGDALSLLALAGLALMVLVAGLAEVLVRGPGRRVLDHA